MAGEPPPSPPRDFAREEQELLRDASDKLAARDGSGRHDDDDFAIEYALRFPPLGRGRGAGSGTGRR